MYGECIAGVFVFASKSRHTLCLSAWSSGVCLSDLPGHGVMTLRAGCRETGVRHRRCGLVVVRLMATDAGGRGDVEVDRKSTRLNSSHLGISYAVFCLKKKINTEAQIHTTQLHYHDE